MAGKTRYLFPRKKSSQLTAKQVALHERRQIAMSLRTAGASYQEIVNANIGYNSTAAVSQDIRKILHSFQYETPEDVLVLDLARLDEMQKIATAHMRSTDWATSMSMLLRIMQFRRETLGITPEVISQRRNESQNLVNNGIMVVQGTASDFLDGMMQAAGATEKERKLELEKVAKSNGENVIDAEVIEEASMEGVGEKAIPFVEKFSQFAENREAADSRSEELASLGLTETLVTADILAEPPAVASTGQQKPKRKLRIPAKVDDSNVNLTSGISYRRAPQKLDDENAKKVVRRRLVRSQRKEDVEDMVDELESETTEESF